MRGSEWLTWATLDRLTRCGTILETGNVSYGLKEARCPAVDREPEVVDTEQPEE